MTGEWLWGSSVARDSNGTYHAFANALKNRCGIMHYRHNSYIIHGTSANALGPFTYQDVALDNRSIGFFDGVEVEDPNVLELPRGEGFLLFYTGATFTAPSSLNHTAQLNCTDGDVADTDSNELKAAQRIGVAFSSSLRGPWEAVPVPVLSTRPGRWDSVRVCNPAALVFPNGTVLLAYRGEGGGHAGIGIARAAHWRGPYVAELEEPLFGGFAEDPVLFWGRRGVIHMVAHGELRGEASTVGVHSASLDGRAWSAPQSAYSLDAAWASGQPAAQLGRREAPQVLRDEKGQPVALFNAAMPCGCSYYSRAAHCLWGGACRSFTMVARFV